MYCQSFVKVNSKNSTKLVNILKKIISMFFINCHVKMTANLIIVLKLILGKIKHLNK